MGAAQHEAQRYIDKNCNINQEFHFAHPICKFQLNSIYNCHFSGCQIWDLFSHGADRFYSTFNRSLKIMADLPLATHRNLLEPLYDQQHMSITLMKNFVKFISSIKKSSKAVLRQLYSIAKADVRTTTGSNLRNILLQTNLSSVDEICPSTVKNIKYKEITDRDMWRIPIIRELIDIKCGETNPPEGWNLEELQEILDMACTG